MSRAFESSSAGDLADDARLECGVCWWVYDPAVGEDTWDTPPGTPFTALADDWRCPSCDAPKSKFMTLSPGAPAQPTGPAPLDIRVAELVAAYEKAEESMLGLPVHNDRLRVEAIGFRPFRDMYLGAVATPWSLNLTLLPADPSAPPPGALGASRTHAFPSGDYSFIIGRMDGVGVTETCSLFSPMDEFDDPDVVRAVAEAALEGLMDVPEEVVAAARKPISRRFILTLNGEER